MIYSTRDFGEVEIAVEDVYHFSQPIFGFEEYTDYIVLRDEEIGDSIVWLQATKNPGLCFILMDPSGFSSFFNPELPEGSDKLLGDGDCFCWVIAVIPQNVKDATVNLKSPVFLNPETHKAAQIILESDYPVRFPLNGGANKC
ncbi:MAG: flagellar assembly protein FliW [Oscillospiraceae bacterium]